MIRITRIRKSIVRRNGLADREVEEFRTKKQDPVQRKELGKVHLFEQKVGQLESGGGEQRQEVVVVVHVVKDLNVNDT